VPVTAAPSNDVDGNLVRFDAFNMLDGEPDTCWRMPGDGTGSEIYLTLTEPTELNEIGLINGYSKRDPGYDGYPANRRITAVEWEFSDGTVVPQTFEEKRRLQSIAIDGVVTETVVLRIIGVTGPGTGLSGRDFTAISAISLLGAPV